jgi:hypothetical protein
MNHNPKKNPRVSPYAVWYHLNGAYDKPAVRYGLLTGWRQWHQD